MRRSLAPALISAAAATRPLHIERTRYLMDKIKENVVEAAVHHRGQAKVEGGIATADNFSRYSAEERISAGKKSMLIEEGTRRDQPFSETCESFSYPTPTDVVCECDDSLDGVLSQTCATTEDFLTTCPSPFTSCVTDVDVSFSLTAEETTGKTCFTLDAYAAPEGWEGKQFCSSYSADFYFTDVRSCEAELDGTSCTCSVCDDSGPWGATDVQVECSDGALSDCFGVLVTDLNANTLSIPQFFGTDGDGTDMDEPFFGTDGDGMDGSTDPFEGFFDDMDMSDMAAFMCLLFDSEELMEDSGMSCSCESKSALLHLSCESDESFEEVCEEGECFSDYNFSMRWSLDANTVELDMCMTFEETQVLEVLGGKEFCFGYNFMMPSFEQMMMGEELVLEGTSCEASIGWFPCECNVSSQPSPHRGTHCTHMETSQCSLRSSFLPGPAPLPSSFVQRRAS